MIISYSLYKIGIILLSLFFISSRAVRFFRKETSQSFFKFLTTILIWTAISLLAAFPPLARFITKTLGMGENLNTLIFIGFIILFILIFKLISLIEKIERNITEIVRKEALRSVLKKDKKNSK